MLAPAYCRDFIVEQLRDFVRDELDADFDEVVQVEYAADVEDAAAFTFTNPSDGERFRVEVTRA